MRALEDLYLGEIRPSKRMGKRKVYDGRADGQNNEGNIGWKSIEKYDILETQKIEGIRYGERKRHTAF